MIEKFLTMMMPPYICKCGRHIGGRWGVKNGRWQELESGCQPGNCLFKEKNDVDSSSSS